MDLIFPLDADFKAGFFKNVKMDVLIVQKQVFYGKNKQLRRLSAHVV